MRQFKLNRDVTFKYLDRAGKKQILRISPYEDEDELPCVHLEFDQNTFRIFAIYGENREGLPRVVTIRVRPNIATQEGTHTHTQSDHFPFSLQLGLTFRFVAKIPQLLLKDLVKNSYCTKETFLAFMHSMANPWFGS